MKWWKTLLLCLATLLLAVALLVWFAPARWVVPWLNARMRGVTLQGVEGSVWQGEAAALVGADGTRFGRLRWQLSRLALLGRPEGHVELTGTLLDARGDFRHDGDTTSWQAVHLRLALDRLDPPAGTPWGRPLGELRADMTQAVLRGGWPVSLDGRLYWPSAAVQSQGQRIALGDLAATVTARNGVIQADLRDESHGPLRLDGHVQASPLGWRLDAQVAPRGDDPDLRRWLARLGPADVQGVVHLKRGAGLGALPSSSGVSR